MEPLSGDDPAQIAAYRVRARLGAGGMGRVYLAYTPGGRPVALKVVRPEFGADPDFRERFRREVDAARRVHGIFTAQVLDADPDAMPPWLVTAYVPGPSLQQAVKDHGPMPPESVFQLMAGVAEALSAIHAAGVVHRDLKPSNVILAPDGPRVIDFGIAQAIDETALTRLGMRVGSPQFMSPEQILGRPPAPPIDVFALGHLAAYAVLGRSAFGTGDPASVFPRILHEPAGLGDCAPPLRTLIEHCIRKDPDARPTPADVLAACREYQTPQTVQVVDTWLPASMAEAVANHPAPPPPKAQPPRVRPPAAPVQQPVPPREPAQPMPMPMPMPQAVPMQSAPMQSGMPPSYPYAGAVPPTGVLPRSNMARAAMAVAAIGIVAGVTIVLLRGHSGANNAQNSTPPAAATASQRFVDGQGSPSAGIDPCLVGTWTGVSEEVTNTISGVPVQFTGLGPTDTLQPDGTGTVDYGSKTVFNATSQGESWEEDVSGSATMRYQGKNGTLEVSDVRASGTWTLYENGVVNNSGQLSLDTAPSQYTCTSTTLTITPPSGALTLERTGH